MLDIWRVIYVVNIIIIKLLNGMHTHMSTPLCILHSSLFGANSYSEKNASLSLDRGPEYSLSQSKPDL